MSLNLENTLVVGISSRALFNLEEENKIYEEKGLREYSKYQIENEKVILKPGSGFQLVKALHNLNTITDGRRLTEIVIMSRNSADTSLRVFNSIEHYGLDITRAALVGGGNMAPYLEAFNTDLFLSANEEDVKEAVNANVASGLICTDSNFNIDTSKPIDKIKIAFDGDAVIFSDESERIYKEKGLEAFIEHEKKNANNPLPEGPFAKLLKTISFIQREFGEDAPIRTALVTARNSLAQERVIRTLMAWDVRVDEAFFLGGVEKSKVLESFGANIFFDDQYVHVNPASKVVPSARVPYKGE